MNQTNINWKRPVVLDFETYYDREYSLRKLTTEAYIRDKRFECMGVSVKVGDNPAQFYPKETGIEVIRELTRTHKDSPFIAHNANFDFGILAFQYGIHPEIMVDTVVLSKLCAFDRVAEGASLDKLSRQLQRIGAVTATKGTTVHDMLGKHGEDLTTDEWQAYGDYCALDVELTYALYMYLIDYAPLEELHMADVTVKMFTKPAFSLDVPLLEAYAVKLEEEKQTLLTRAGERLGFKDTEALLGSMRSSKKFADVLASLGVRVPMKWSEKQNKYIPALSKTDTEFLALLEHEDDIIRVLVETKLGVASSLVQTRTQNFLAVASRGLFPVALRYASAHTGRYGGGDSNKAKGSTNVQNLPKRTGDLTLRRSLRAKEGHIVIASDSTQIELRINAFMAGQQDLIDVFKSGRDPYVDMATVIFNKSYDEIYHEAKVVGSKEGKRMRNLGKETSLAGGYGMSASTFRTRMILSGQHEAAEMADDLIQAFRLKNNRIVNFWRECHQAILSLYAGNTYRFGGSNNDLFLADGSSEFFGKKIPSIRFPNGTYLFYQNLRREAGEDGRPQFVYDQFKDSRLLPARVWGSLLDENLCQKLAFDVLKYQALLIYRQGVPINLNVHDEWVSVVPRTQAPHALAVHYNAMRSAPAYIPEGLLNCEVDIGLNYADLKTINVGGYLWN